MEQKPSLPPFDSETVKLKVQLAENAWNSRDPERVVLSYTVDTEWRNRSEFINGREAVVQFLKLKCRNELNYKLKKELWALAATGSPLGLNTSIMTMTVYGLEPMVTKTGNLMNTD